MEKKRSGKNSEIAALSFVRQIIESIKPIWKDAADLNGKVVDFDTQLDESLTLTANPTLLRQVVSNLLINAVEAIEHRGTVTIRAWQESGQFRLEVRDDGVGMTQQELDSCRARSYTTKHDHLGFGLSVCSDILARLGGRLEIESEFEVGSTFGLRIPQDSSSPEPANRNQDDSPPSAEIQNANRLRILVIDDDQFVRRSICTLLRTLGVDSSVVEDGDSAMKLIEQQTFDLVVTDLGMPGMNGVDVVRAIRSRGDDTRVAVISGWAPDEIRERFNGHAQPDHIIAKPLRIDQLKRIFAELRQRDTI